MKLARVGARHSEIPVVVDPDTDTMFDLRSITDDIDSRFFATDGIARARTALDRGDLLPIDVEGMRIGAPIAKPGIVVGVGMNYVAHAAESGAPPPTEPILFLKPGNAVSGPYDPLILPPESRKTDWEVELGVVIGSRIHHAESPAVAMRSIAGFVAVNDVSERDYQLQHPGAQWSKGKSYPGFAPTGPYLLTADEIDHTRLRLRSWVNGNSRQDSTSSDMIFGVDYLLWYASQFSALDPGDLVITGTPEGVALSGRFPYLEAEDIVEIEVDGLGRQRYEVHAAVQNGASDSAA